MENNTEDQKAPPSPPLGKLRHIALSVPDIQATARFYEQAFGMHRVRESKVAVMMSDGVMSLAIIDSNMNPNTPDRKVGLHHFGFLIPEMGEAAATVENAGAVYHGQIKGVGGGAQTERKYRDLNGVMFDIVNETHAKTVWCIPV